MTEHQSRLLSRRTNQLGPTFSFTRASGATRTLTLSNEGTTINALIDDNTVIGPITDSSVTAAGQVGIRVQANAIGTNFAVVQKVTTQPKIPL